jgi:hypothetical protein
MVAKEESEAVAAQLPDAGFKILPDTLHPIEKVNVARQSDIKKNDFKVKASCYSTYSARHVEHKIKAISTTAPPSYNVCMRPNLLRTARA